MTGQFPPEEQNRVRLSVAGVIQGVISQRLVPTVDGGRRAAMEILVRTPTVEKLIMENRDYEIRDAIESGKEHYGSQSFDQSILDLYQDGVISLDQALKNATSASDLQLKISGLSSGQASADAPEGIQSDFSEDEIFGLK